MSATTKAEAPPGPPKSSRKAKINQTVKNVHGEQLAKLQARQQTELDFLEDIRDFAKQKSTLEKAYAQGLLKLVSTYQQKNKDLKCNLDSNDEEKKTAVVVWKSLLEESDKVAKAKLTSAEALLTQVVEPIKTTKTYVAQLYKKGLEVINRCQDEFQVSLQAMLKSKKGYTETETIAQEMRGKTAEAENRLKTGSLRRFQSKANLEKNTVKLTTRRDECNKLSTQARNEYIISLDVANAHQKKYYIEMPKVISVMFDNLYEKLKEYLNIFCITEIETSTLASNGFNKVLSETDKILNTENELKLFLDVNPVFVNVPQYPIQPVGNDTETRVRADYNLGLELNKEARKWAMLVVRERKLVNDRMEALRALEAPEATEKKPQQAGQLKQLIRTAELLIMKTEVKLEALKPAGIDVDEWLKGAHETVAQEEEAKIKAAANNTSQDYLGIGDYSREEQDSSFLDDTFDQSYSVQYIALYDYEAQREDELTIRQNEYLEIVEEAEGDGWIKGKNQNGEIGYFPENYVERLEQSSPPTGYHQQSSYASSSTVSSTEAEAVTAAVSYSGQFGSNAVCMVRALYDYEGINAEELSFTEGQLIKVLRKDENGVDDGFWEGEVNGTVGVFPSMVVEEVSTPITIPSGISTTYAYQLSPEDQGGGPTSPSISLPPAILVNPSLERRASIEVESFARQLSHESDGGGPPRSASANIAENGNYIPEEQQWQPKSAPQSPNRIIPARAAPPPPKN